MFIALSNSFVQLGIVKGLVFIRLSGETHLTPEVICGVEFAERGNTKNVVSGSG